MTQYPIKVDALSPYYGDDPKKQAKFQRESAIAERIGQFINQKMETDFKGRKSGMITFGQIASALGLKDEQVQSYLYKFSGSSENSIEVQNP
jgi:hypothetical protein